MALIIVPDNPNVLSRARVRSGFNPAESLGNSSVATTPTPGGGGGAGSLDFTDPANSGLIVLGV